MNRILKTMTVLIVIFMIGLTNQLQAKGIHIFVTSGEEVIFIAHIPHNFMLKDNNNTNITNYNVGFKYFQESAYYIEFWSWGGQYCLYDSTNLDYIELSQDQIKFLNEQIPGGLNKPLFYTFPVGLIIITFGILIFLIYKIISNNSSKNKTRKKYLALIRDPRYIKALDIITGHQRNLFFEKKVKDPKELGSEKDLMNEAYRLGLFYLTNNGINSEEAKSNLALINSIQPIKFRRIF